ncbi:Uncharacterised protein [Sphingobacterium daejeonense]|nr:Uncharacterised protein [Sphingobacterium daejeonense]
MPPAFNPDGVCGDYGLCNSVTPSGVLFFGVTFFYNSCTPSGVTWIEIIDGVTWIENN